MTVARTELPKPIEARNISESPERGEISSLTLREIQVLMQLGKGSTYKKIARELGIGKNTAKNYSAHIFDKLNVDTRTEAALVFQRTLLISHQVSPNFTLEEFQNTLSEMAQTRASWMSELALSNIWEPLKTTGVSPLLPRETAVLIHLSQGLFNKEIARELGIDLQTVKNHVNQILNKLNVDTRTEAALLFQQALFITYQQNPDFSFEEFENTFLKTAQDKDSWALGLAFSHLERLLKTEARIRKERTRKRREQKEKRIKKIRKTREAIILLLAQGMSFKKIADNLECSIIVIATYIRYLYEEFGIDGRDPRRRELLVEKARKRQGI